jgi:hypothetical protein
MDSLLIGIVVKNLVLDIILALANEPAARTLTSRIANRTLSSDLAITYSRVDSNELDIASVILLVEKVIQSESAALSSTDVYIWNAVFELVSQTGPKAIAPPTALENTVFDTPLRSSSASQRGIEQTHEEVDQRILEEFTGRVYYDVEGLYERYFEGKAGRTRRGISTKSQFYNMQRVDGAIGQNFLYRASFLSGL